MEQNFLRPIVPETFSPLTSDIIFQPIDWKSCDLKAEKLGEDDEEEEEDYDEDDYEEDEDGGFKKKYSNKKNLVLRTYGVTEEGHSICVHIEGFQPYFYFKIPQDWEKPQFDYFVEKVKEKVDFFNRKGLIIGTIVNKKEFYGFTNNELFKFGVFTFRNQAAYRSYLKVFKEEKILLNKLGIELDLSASLYETKVDALLRFFHVQNLDPAGWCKLTAGKYILNRKNKKTRCQLDVTIHFQNIEKVDKSSISKIMIASYDIECVSEDGSFPKAERANDKIIQIGTSVNIFGEDECCFRYIAVLGDCLPIEGARVECFKTEKDLIIGWARFMAKLDPDVITGYNIWGFDWEFLYKRAEYGFEPNGRKSPYHKTLVKILQRIEKLETGKKEIDDNTFKLTEKQLSSSAMGDNFLKFIDIEGVVQIDLLKYFQREEKFDSYKLDNVAKEIIGQQKEDLKPHEIFENFRIGTPDKIREIATYCIQDCVLVNNLMNKKKVITNNLGMANVCVVPFSFIFLRGQGIKIFSLVVKFSREDNFLIKDLPSEKDESSYEGAIVFVPKPGIYFEPVVVMDYNSLYPSSMIAENISHDSILGYKEYRLKPGKSGENKEEDYELIADTIAYKYMDLPGYHYIDIEYDVFHGVDKEKKKVGYKMCRFAELDEALPKNFNKKSVLPRILVKLLKARKDTRKKMEYVTHTMKDGTIHYGIPTECDDGTIELFNVDLGTFKINKDDVVSSENTYTSFERKVLDALQLAYKVTCNSLYGQVGAGTSNICYKELAACTTATGRRMVCNARDYTLETFAGSKLTYGDSVTGDTPLLLKNNENAYPHGVAKNSEGVELFVKNIKDLNDDWVAYDEFKPQDSNRIEKQQTTFNAQIWTSNGWANIVRVIRHKTQKKIYRILTHTGCVDVTEDHSLLDENLNKLKPTEVSVGTKLRHCSPFKNSEEFNEDNKITTLIFNMNEYSKLDIQKKYIELRKNGYYVYFENSDNDNCLLMSYSYSLFYNIEDENKIIKILEIRKTDFDEYVYDIETTDGTFQAGVGQMIVKNTDSVFINFTDHIKQQNPGKEFTEYELLVESIQMGIKAAKNINSHMKAPQNIEYEKTLWPFVIFSKKRYFGNLYEHDPQEYKPKYMGIVLKRRDNAPVVKTIYGGVLDIILNKRNIEASKQFFIKSVEDLMQGKVNINQLVISKTLKADYANPNQIAHKVLADRMGERDPGNKPQSNDRIPYCYIDDSNLKCTICNGKVNAEKCKCITCTRMFCPNHLPKHKDVCIKTCRFCKLTEKQIKVTKCGTCLAYYCNKCNEKHMKRKDKYNKVHMDKCKKPLTHKILQGDILEHPEYITANNVKIDYRYYLDHQIWEPVKQIFALVMDKPEKLIESILRKSDNAKKGNHAITDWFKKMGMENVDEDLPSKQNKIKNDSELSETHTELSDINIEELTSFNINNDVDNDEQNADDEDKNVLETLMGKDLLSELEEAEENENGYDIQDNDE